MSVRLVALAFAAVSAAELAPFWAHALRWSVRDQSEGGGVELVPTDATSFGLLIQGGAGPKSGQNRIHFDLTTTSLAGQRDTVAPLLAVGAPQPTTW